MSRYNEDKSYPTMQQEANTSKLVLNTFYKISTENGVTPSDISNYLQDKFGDLWKVNSLTGKAEETLKKSAALGFLQRFGNRYIASMARANKCGKCCPGKKKPAKPRCPRCCKKKKKPSCCGAKPRCSKKRPPCKCKPKW